MHDQAHSMLLTGARCSRSYLLRLWREAPASPWRAMLRDGDSLAFSAPILPTWPSKGAR